MATKSEIASSASASTSDLNAELETLCSQTDTDEGCLDELVKKCQGDLECCVTLEGGDGDNLATLFNDCPKNPGHKRFIPVSEFKKENLPKKYQTDRMMKSIKYWSDLTVKIMVRYVSKDRPLTYPDSDMLYPYANVRGSRRLRRIGTGNVFGLASDEDKVQEAVCPCHLCEILDVEEREKSYWTFLVETSKHVVFDTSEAKRSVFECFYDSDETREATVKVLYGYAINEKLSTIEQDFCQVACVTHDQELMEKLKGLADENPVMILPQYSSNLGVLISHPHGCSKRISLGRVHHLVVPVGWDYPAGVSHPFDDTVTCRLPLYPWSVMPESTDNPSNMSQGKQASSSSSYSSYLSPTPESDNNQIKEEMKPTPCESGDQHLTSKMSSPISDDNPNSNADPLDEDPDTFDPKPGTEFLLPLGTTFRLHPDAAFAFQFSRLNSVYFRLPPKTTFTLRNGRELFLPPEAEFSRYLFSARVSYVSYSTDSCPGSSGAGLLQDGGHGVICCTFPHCGADNAMKGANRSGLQSYTILPKSMTEGQDDEASADLIASIMPQYVRFEYLSPH